MTVQTTGGALSQRTTLYAQKELLKRSLPHLILEKFGQSRPVPERMGRVTTFRRYESLNTTVSSAVMVEGVTPAADTMTRTDVSATLIQYGRHVTYSDVILDTHEDPILQEAVALLGEQAAIILERMRFDRLLAGTNVHFTNGASRAAVNTRLTLAAQRRATRELKRQNARTISTVLKSTPDYGTEAVAAAYIGICHPDVENDLRAEASFIPVERYATATSMYENEIGKMEDVRYLTTTLLGPYLGAPNAGGAVGAMIPNNVTVTNAAVYPVLILGRDAFGIVPFKGLKGVTVNIVNAQASDSDPHAQRTHVAWKTMQTCVILNDFNMVRIECAVTA